MTDLFECFKLSAGSRRFSRGRYLLCLTVWQHPDHQPIYVRCCQVLSNLLVCMKETVKNATKISYSGHQIQMVLFIPGNFGNVGESATEGKWVWSLSQHLSLAQAHQPKQNQLPRTLLRSLQTASLCPLPLLHTEIQTHCPGTLGIPLPATALRYSSW